MNYWKLTTAIERHKLAILSLRIKADAENAALKAAFIEAGLDPAKNYIVDDAKETFTEQVPDGS